MLPDDAPLDVAALVVVLTVQKLYTLLRGQAETLPVRGLIDILGLLMKQCRSQFYAGAWGEELGHEVV